AHTPAEVPDMLRRLDMAVKAGLHAAGYLSYELGYALEPRLAPLMPASRRLPLLWLGLFRSVRHLAPAETEAWLAERDAGGACALRDVRLDVDEAGYLDRFDVVKEKIAAGDIYQLNLTLKARFQLDGSPVALYRELRRKQRVAHGALISTSDVTLVSLSPELFVKVSDRTIETRPMKGTAPRAGTPDADAEARAVLRRDPKQRAENLMIVDLMRNDIGRIAEVGSVHVSELFTVETYRTLHQMTSNVRARLSAGVGPSQLIEALFPAGSITGTPKIRAMELIRELEPGPREVYTGSIGAFMADGSVALNVAIRTAVIHGDGAGEMGIGSGLVADSVGLQEFAECKLKMRFLVDPAAPFQLIETLLYDGRAGYWLLQRHLDRLAASAAYFDFPCDLDDVRARLTQAVATALEARLRVRLLLHEDGTVTVTTAPQPAPAGEAVMRYVVSPTPVSSADPFLFHKTTRRQLYDSEHAIYAASHGADEVVYLNERGELAEGSRTNIFVMRDGVLLTPPLSAGLLPGTLRSELLASGTAVEATLTPDMLATAAAVYLGNSVRGLVRAEPIQAPPRSASA
ncbi:MAG: aminodeoxychorismate synthase component I, partial [Hyphomicrobiaceae bacterium]|nr:aminodeoxychorismate synthase component I [Hyphomicrobiaceae bacterium]